MLDVISRITPVMSGSLRIRSSIFRMELSAVVWFRPSSFPMSFRERLVSCRMRYMEICLAMAVFLERLFPFRSSDLRD